MRRTLFNIIFLLSVLLLAGCGGSNDTSSGAQTDPTPTTDATPEETPATDSSKEGILVLGDSIGTGAGASKNFPSMIESLTGLKVTNASIYGASAAEGIARAPDLINRLKPKYLVVLLGTNNARGLGGGVSGAINSLQSVTNLANQNGVIPIIGTLPPIPRSSSENANAAAISRGILGISGARIARIDQAVNASDISDGIHPGNSGQEKIARLFADQID